MTLLYQVLCGLAVLGFAGLDQPVLGQVVPTADDSLKGRIWTVTAQRLWEDAKLSESKPKKWNTSKEFMDWLLSNSNAKAAKQSELGVLQPAVVDRIKQVNQGSSTGTPEQLSQAILAVIAKQHEEKKGALGRVNPDILRAELGKNIPAISARMVEFATEAPAETVASPAASTKFPEDTTETPDPSVASESAVNYPVPVSSDTHFGMPFWAAALALVLAGAGVGAVLHALLKPTRRSSRRHRTSEYSAESENSVDMHSQEYKQLKKENQLLRGEVHHLKIELAELKAQIAGKPAPEPIPALIPTPELEPADADLLSPMPLAAIPVERLSQPPATRYGPVQEMPFLEERKIVDTPLPQLALMLTINSETPDQAVFTLNPQVNQDRLIGNGLNRLQKFFDYDMPVGRISSVTAAASGKLQRQADGWQVVERARLIIR